ncbi:hypothetical protein C3L33_21430, partial [Rhododendron williamsianum]
MVSLATALGLCSKSPFPNHQSKEKMALRQLISFNRTAFSSTPSHLAPGFANFSSKSTPYIVKVGIPEFLNGVGKGVETHVEKLESEIGDIQKLLVTREVIEDIDVCMYDIASELALVTSEKYVDEKVDEHAFKAVSGELAKKLEAPEKSRRPKDVPRICTLCDL